VLNDRPVSELIQKRTSCRSYADTPIAVETQAELAKFLRAERVGAFGTEVRAELLAATQEDQAALKGLGTYGFIRGATGYIAGAVAREAPMAMEDFGYVMERTVLYATALGLGTVWLGGTFTKSRFARAMALRDEETLPAVVATGYAAARPRGLDALIRRGAKADQRLPWEALFFDGAFDTPLTREAAGAYAKVLEMVRSGPSASNKQPWRVVRDGERWHLYLRRTRRYAPRNAVAGVEDMQRIDMGIAMCHFGLVAEELGLPGGWVQAEPGILLPDDLISYVGTWQAQGQDHDSL
jgi:nitroreductase